MRLDVTTAHETEHRLLAAISEVRQELGYALFRSAEFPGFYDGNYLELQPPPQGATLAELERMYCAHFDQQRFAHMNIMGLEGSGIEALIEPARAAGFDVSRSTYLLASEPLAPARPLPDELCIRRVDSPARWQLMRAFDDENDREQPWYTPATSAMLSERRARVSEAVGISWLYVSPRTGDEMLAKLGVFSMPAASGDVGRLQDVATTPAHRRRGLATALVAAALHETLQRRGCAGLFVCADTDDMPIHMYRKQGFRDLGLLYRLFRMRASQPR